METLRSKSMARLEPSGDCKPHAMLQLKEFLRAGQGVGLADTFDGRGRLIVRKWPRPDPRTNYTGFFLNNFSLFLSSAAAAFDEAVDAFRQFLLVLLLQMLRGWATTAPATLPTWQ